MKLKTLLQDWVECPREWDREISGLTLNSQHIQSGFLFIATQGSTQDGRRFIEDAIAKGASAVLCEAQGAEGVDFSSAPVPVLRLPGLKVVTEDLAIKFYGDPSASLKMCGVTGTNGKTTSTFLLAQAQTRLGIPTAVLGTLGYGYTNDLTPTMLTTPDPISIQKYLFELKQQGVKAVAMEVSSHGLEQNRAKSIRFESALFTNLTQDHLDYHLTMDNYAKTKQKLFQVPSLRRAIINADSPYADKMVMATRLDLPIILYSLQPAIPRVFSKERDLSMITVNAFSQNAKGIIAEVQTPWGKSELRSPLLGEFNLSNLLGVLAELCSQGFNLKEVCEALSFATPPPGRMQRMGGVRDPLIIIDYAHTPDALENAINAAKLHCKRRLWCVFGCGGGRDREKREQMGQIAGKLADKIILTNDNPRMEDPKSIIDNILQGFQVEWMDKVVVEENRAKAIEYALAHALPVDTILIAGKGHEDYQIMGDVKLPFSDHACVEQLLRKD